MKRIKSLAAELQPELLRIRRHLHAHPELSFQEFETSQFVKSCLTEYGIPFQAMTETGVVGLIQGKNPHKRCIALRADMDALPIAEANDVGYRSQTEGVMHACGHDVHTTCLLGAAKILYNLRAEWEGTVKLIFQPGEEKSPGGASLMIDAGVLENPAPDAILGLHVDPSLPVGMAGFRPEQYMASADEIYMIIRGKGGHAALPHLTVDPIAIAAQIITTLQQIVSRKNNALIPTVLSFGKICGGHTTNVIPDTVELQGTLRTFDETWRKEALQLIRDISGNIAAAFGGTVELTIPSGYPSLYNDETTTLQAESAAKTYLGESNVVRLDRRMTAEDFSFYSLKTRACFFRLGTNNNNETFKTPVHHAQFDIHEAALETGAGLMSWIALQMLN
jgi:amidohydrolase